jgi:hypothetical protein
MGLAWTDKGLPTFTYRFNQPNPTSSEPHLTEHAAEVCQALLLISLMLIPFPRIGGCSWAQTQGMHFLSEHLIR